ncbi:N-methyl-L-tryptophan oxidase [Gordonia sp. KTR9]|uniref:N-methyl-L-tryptophan oxidase n=1 Tax=Gordonia sp. KTR9 TaxID=337191 RepID=UPI00027DDE1E|nr:N-methyl-L-tryptophan oxidase [Gordonia sp. KTR9]AFR47280.1 D-amino acid oxidase [Gordonia sp. KTR9]
MSTSRVDTVVVGGGAMGSAAAWHLAQRGVETVLLERFTPGHTNGASHGSSRIFRTSYADATYAGLALEAQQQWRQLEAETGTSLLTVTGGVDQGHPPYLAEIAGTLGELGVEHHWLPPEEATRRWPGISFPDRVLFYPGSGRLHADDAVTALQNAAVARGAEVRHNTQVLSIEVDGDDAVAVRTDDHEYLARRVVVAAGAWAEKLVGHLVPLPAIRVTQEQPAHFAPLDRTVEWPSFTISHDPDAPETRPFGGVYGLSSGDEGVKVGFHGVGPVVDPDHRDFTAEPRQLAALQDYVREWIPGVDADRPVPISCTYATTADSNFIIDRVGPVTVAAGFSGHGFKFVPAIGRLLADLTAGKNAPTLFSFRERTAERVS